MAVRNIPVRLPDGQENAIIQYLAEEMGWTASSELTYAQYVAKEVCDYLRSIYLGRRLREFNESNSSQVRQINADGTNFIQ